MNWLVWSFGSVCFVAGLLGGLIPAVGPFAVGVVLAEIHSGAKDPLLLPNSLFVVPAIVGHAIGAWVIAWIIGINALYALFAICFFLATYGYISACLRKVC